MLAPTKDSNKSFEIEAICPHCKGRTKVSKCVVISRQHQITACCERCLDESLRYGWTLETCATLEQAIRLNEKFVEDTHITDEDILHQLDQALEMVKGKEKYRAEKWIRDVIRIIRHKKISKQLTKLLGTENSYLAHWEKKDGTV